MAKEDKEKVALWSAFLAGEEQAFSQLFFDYYELLYQYGYRIHPNSAIVKDVIQDFFLHLYETREGLSSNLKSVKAYLLISFRRRLLQEVKKQRQFKHSLDDFFQHIDHPFAIGMEDIIINQESNMLSKKLIGELLAELPPRQREIIYLKYYLDLSLPEIAETLQISYQVVANHLYRALKKLRGSSTHKKFFKHDIWLLLVLCPTLVL